MDKTCPVSPPAYALVRPDTVSSCHVAESFARSNPDDTDVPQSVYTGMHDSTAEERRPLNTSSNFDANRPLCHALQLPGISSSGETMKKETIYLHPLTSSEARSAATSPTALSADYADSMRVRTYGGFALHIKNGDYRVPVASSHNGVSPDAGRRTPSDKLHQNHFSTDRPQVENRFDLTAAGGDGAGGNRDGAASVLSLYNSQEKMALESRYQQNTPDDWRRRARKCCHRVCSKDTFADYFPIVRWAPNYTLGKLKCDVIAGLTVGFTVIPQGLAYGAVATLPVQYGLYSAFMGCFVYMFLGTSKDVTLGPTAISSLMTAEYLSDIEDDNERIKYAVLLCLITGFVQLVMGFLQLGFLVRFISHPVIVGFVSSAALTIAVSQIDNVFGFSVASRDFVPSVLEFVSNIGTKTRWLDLILGTICIISLFGMRALGTYATAHEHQTCRRGERIRQSIFKYVAISRNAIVFLLACSFAAILESTKPGMLKLTKQVTAGIPTPRLPEIVLDKAGFLATLRNLGSGVILMPLIALLESLAIGKAFANRNNYSINSTQEIIAIGACNVVSSFFQSMPVTGSFSRTALNSQCNVKTPAGGLWTGALVLLALGVLSPLFRFVPEAALGAVIISAVLPMFEWHEILLLWRVRKIDLLPCLVTFFGCLGLGIEIGIAMGVSVSLMMLVYALARPEIKVVEWLSHRMVLIKPHAALYFPSGEYLQNIVQQTMESIERRGVIPKKSSSNNLADIACSDDIIRILLDASCVADFDASTMRAMKTIIDMVAKEPHFELFFVNLNVEAKRLLMVAGCKEVRMYDALLGTNESGNDESLAAAHVAAVPVPPSVPRAMSITRPPPLDAMPHDDVQSAKVFNIVRMTPDEEAIVDAGTENSREILRANSLA